MDEPTSSLAEREVGQLFGRDPPAARRGRGDRLRLPPARRAVRGLRPRSRCCATAAPSPTRPIGRAVPLRPGLDDARPRAGRAERRERSGVGAAAKDGRPDRARGARPAPRTGARTASSLTCARARSSGLAGLLGSGPHGDGTRPLRRGPPRRRRDRTSTAAGRGSQSPRDAIGRGIGFGPEDRKAEGIIPTCRSARTSRWPCCRACAAAGIVDRGRQQRDRRPVHQALGIKLPSPDQPIRELSGGNQQKVLLARWLCTEPEAPDPRRADPRHRRRRQARDPGAGPRARRRRAWRCSSSPRSSRR